MAAPAGIETDATLMAHAVGELARQTRFPVAFGGLEHDGAVHVTSVVGGRTRSLEGLVVQASRGLGGRALIEKRPRLALDYRSSRAITHDYDRAVLGEGISTLFAIPVLVRGNTRGVLYCGSWAQTPVGDVVTRPAFDVAGELATELRVREEVERRLAAVTAAVPSSSESSSLDSSASASPAFTAAAQEQLRESFAELRSISATLQDDALRERLSRVQSRLAVLSHGRADTDAAPDVHLSPREIDVLACAALGDTNAQIAASLGLREVTVKSYLQAAMAKLDAATRHAAVAKARRAGILP